MLMRSSLRTISVLRRVSPTQSYTSPLVCAKETKTVVGRRGPLCANLSETHCSLVQTPLRHCSTNSACGNAGTSNSINTNETAASSSSNTAVSVESLREAALRPWQSKLKGDDIIQNVPWVCNERLDFYFSFWSPASWTLQEVVRENFISIQLSPPQEAKASVHGISITAFAYHRKVENPYSPELLKSFTRRFISQVDPSGKVIDEVSTTSKLAQDLNNSEDSLSGGAISSSNAGINRQLREIVEKAGGSVCQMTFAPRTAAGTRTAAKGLCRAFYHPNRRFHYVILAAVPENEYDLVTPLLSHAVCSASELAAGSDKGTRL